MCDICLLQTDIVTWVIVKLNATATKMPISHKTSLDLKDRTLKKIRHFKNPSGQSGSENYMR